MKFVNKNKKQYDLISISHYFPPRIGGLENMAFTLLEELSEKDVKCLAIFGSDEKYSIQEDGFKKVSFKPLNIFENTYPIFGMSFFLFVLKTLKENPDAKVVIHSRHLTSSLLTNFACSFLSRPYTVIEHNAGKVYMSSKPATDLVNWLDRNIFTYVLQEAQDIISVSKTGRKWISKNFKISKERVRVIHNSHNLDPKDIDLEKKENIVVWASKWINVKNPQMVLRAYQNIAKKYPNWLFLLIGKGSALDYESVKLPENVRVIEQMLPQNELFKLLKESKIYINSSFSEGLAIANLEAIAYGNIPLLSNAPSNKEVAKIIGSLKYIFKRGNSKDLSKTIERAIKNSEDTEDTKKIIKKSNDFFSKESMVGKYYEMLLPEHFDNENLKTVSIVIPVYNEENTVKKILDMVAKVKFPNDIKKEIIVVNDASKDKSKEYINSVVKKKYKNTEFLVLENKKNLGKSQTVKAGILASTGDLVVTQDADLEYNPNELVLFVKEFLNDPYTAVIYGNRFNSKNSFDGSVHSLGNKFVTYLSNLFTRPKGFAPTDMETCYKMVRGDIMRNLFKTLESTSNFGLEPELTAKLARYRKMNGQRLKFREIDISYIPRTLSQGKKMRWFKHGFEALLEILYFNTNSYIVEEEYRGKRIKRVF
jgi:glycosyltransferase involved in cell wall biosynthesis